MKTLDRQLCEVLKNHDIKAWLCGGSVRDFLLKKPITAYDFAVDANISELLEKLKPRIVNVNEFSTSVTIQYKEMEFILYPLKKIELVNNAYYNFSYTSDVLEDSCTRDFTINSIYYDPITKEIIDPNNGRQDLKNKIIRFTGNPETRILESKVRILRAMTLLARLGKGWTIEDNSLNAIKKHSLKLWAVNNKLINQELNKLFEFAENPSIAFTTMNKIGILNSFFPELGYTVNIPQSNKQAGLTLIEHIMFAMDSIPPNKPNSLYMRLAALLHDIGKPYTEITTHSGTHFYTHEVVGAHIAENILYRWGYQRPLIKKISLLIQNHLFDALTRSDSSIKKLIYKVGTDNIHDLLDLRVADRLGTGRSNISMDKILRLKEKINNILKIISPDNIKLDISDNEIKSLLLISNNGDEVKAVKYFILQKIIHSKLDNKNSSLKKAIAGINNIKCPLGIYHLFTTHGELQTDSADVFPDKKLKCGVFCNFLCDSYNDDRNNN